MEFYNIQLIKRKEKEEQKENGGTNKKQIVKL